MSISTDTTVQRLVIDKKSNKRHYMCTFHPINDVLSTLSCLFLNDIYTVIFLSKLSQKLPAKGPCDPAGMKQAAQHL